MKRSLIKFLFLCILFQYSVTLKLLFNPNDLKINFNSEKLPKLFEGLLRAGHFQLVITLLKSESSDFVPSYCKMWGTIDNSDIIFKLWDGRFAGELDANQLSSLILPECVAGSCMTMINLSEAMIKSLPHSLMQVSDFPINLVDSRIVDCILRKAVYKRPHDPRIKWYNWVLNDDIRRTRTSKFYMKFGWQLVSREDFNNLNKNRIDQLFSWLLLPSSEAFTNQLSDEEALMRTLTLIYWDSPSKCSAVFEFLKKRLLHKFSGKSSIVSSSSSSSPSSSSSASLALKLMTSESTDFPTDLLDLIDILEVYLNKSPNNILIGDWFIDILEIWQEGLKRLFPTAVNGVEIVNKILRFALTVVDPTFQGMSRLPELFDESFRLNIENAVHGKYSNDPESIKLFYREYPDFFQDSVLRIPFHIRFSTLLRMKRAQTKGNAYSQTTDPARFDMKVFWEKGAKKFLMFAADLLKHGIDKLSRFSLDPLVGIRYAGTPLSFRILIKLFLTSINVMKSEWFTTVNEGIIPLPRCPNLMWELLGYFLVQARILNIPSDIHLEKEFVMEMVRTPSSEYLEKVTAPFNNCKYIDNTVLTFNAEQSFSVASVFPPEELFYFKNQGVDCKNLARLLYIKGMSSMRNGINHVLEPFKFTDLEVYKIVNLK